MAEIRYATEENIRTLIELINAKLKEYSTSEEIDVKLTSYLESDEFEQAVKAVVGDINPEDPDEENYTNYLKYKIDFTLPEEGEENTLYFIIDTETSPDSKNRYNEYMWIPGTGFELLGTSDENSGMTYKAEFVLPDTGEPNTIYLIPKTAEGNNRCDEYIWLKDEGRFELLGPTGLSPLSLDKVEHLPDMGKGNVLYLLPKEGSIEGIYEAYLWSDEITEEDSPFGHFDLIGTLGFDPIFATEEDLDPLYEFLIKPYLTKEVTISSREPGEM